MGAPAREARGFDRGFRAVDRTDGVAPPTPDPSPQGQGNYAAAPDGGGSRTALSVVLQGIRRFSLKEIKKLNFRTLKN
jgi:hypothetical protein